MLFLNFILVFAVASGQEFVKAEKNNKVFNPMEEKFPFENDYYKDHYYQPYFQEPVAADVNSAENYVKFPPHRGSKVLLSIPSIVGWYAGPKSTMEPLEEPVSDEPAPESSTDNQEDKKINAIRYNSAIIMKDQKDVSSEYETENEGWLADSYEQQLPLEVTEKQFSNDATNKSRDNERTLDFNMPPTLNSDSVAATDPINQFLNLKQDTPREEIDRILSRIEVENVPEKLKLKFLLKLAEFKYSLKIRKVPTKRENPNGDFSNRKTSAEKKANDETLDEKVEVSEEKESMKNNNITIFSENSEKYTIQNGSETIVLETKHSMVTKKYKINEKPKTVKTKESKKSKLIESLKKKINNILQMKYKEKAEEPQPIEENAVFYDLNANFNKRKNSKTNQTGGKRESFRRIAIPEVNLPIGYEMGPPFMFQPPKPKNFYPFAEPEQFQKKNQEGKKYKFLRWTDV